MIIAFANLCKINCRLRTRLGCVHYITSKHGHIILAWLFISSITTRYSSFARTLYITLHAFHDRLQWWAAAVSSQHCLISLMSNYWDATPEDSSAPAAKPQRLKHGHCNITKVAKPPTLLNHLQTYIFISVQEMSRLSILNRNFRSTDPPRSAWTFFSASVLSLEASRDQSMTCGWQNCLGRTVWAELQKKSCINIVFLW